jgi:signal peptidase II
LLTDAEPPHGAADPDPGSRPPADPAPLLPARQAGLLWTVSAVTVVVDQVAKAIIQHTLPLYGSRTLIPGALDLVHVHNAGVAFGLLNDLEHPGRALLTTSLALAALVGIAYYARHIHPSERLARVGLSLILGGAVGNLADRVRQGFVVDFVDVYWRGWHFWAFNVADSAITIGAIFVFVDLLFLNRHAPHPV